MGITKAEKCSYSKMLSILTFRAWYSCTFWLPHSLMHIKFVAYLHPKSLLPPSLAASDLWYIQNTHPTTLSSPILFSVNSDFLTSLNTVLCSCWCSQLFSICQLALKFNFSCQEHILSTIQSLWLTSPRQKPSSRENRFCCTVQQDL